jgi:tRNA G37 N-methylase Trm5
MKITKEIKELAKEIHKAEHLFVEKKISKDHKLEDYYYLLGSIVFTKLKESIDNSNTELFNKLVDVQNEVRALSNQMKEVSKQQKYLWQTLEENKDVAQE